MASNVIHSYVTQIVLFMASFKLCHNRVIIVRLRYMQERVEIIWFLFSLFFKNKFCMGDCITFLYIITKLNIVACQIQTHIAVQVVVLKAYVNLV